MSRHSSSHSQARVYIGNLGDNASKREIEKEFEQFGPLQDVWVARNPPGFAFCVFEDKRDAEDAVRELDGIYINGEKIRVELARGTTRGGRAQRLGLTEKCYDCGRVGHFARDCTRRGQRRFRSRSRSPPRRRYRSRSRSRSPPRRRYRSRSRSPRHRPSRSRSRSVERKSRSKSRSPSPDRKEGSRSPSQSPKQEPRSPKEAEAEKSPSKSRSPSPAPKNDDDDE